MCVFTCVLGSVWLKTGTKRVSAWIALYLEPVFLLRGAFFSPISTGVWNTGFRKMSHLGDEYVCCPIRDENRSKFRNHVW